MHGPEIVARHDAKVYGKAAVGAPPMSVPHLDTRYVGGKRSLMFGPYAGWTPKFLKTGRYTDLFESIKPSNITQMLAVAPPNLDLMVYLGSQLAATHQQRFDAAARVHARRPGLRVGGGHRRPARAGDRS